MQHEEFRTQLEAALTTVTADLQQLGIQDPLSSDWVTTPIGADVADADKNLTADVIEDWNTRRAILSELETRYRNIKRALQKMDTGTYGICEISGQPIEAERLAANPAARTNLVNQDRERELPM